jgi:hypothetical protein
VYLIGVKDGHGLTASTVFGFRKLPSMNEGKVEKHEVNLPLDWAGPHPTNLSGRSGGIDPDGLER